MRSPGMGLGDMMGVTIPSDVTITIRGGAWPMVGGTGGGGGGNGWPYTGGNGVGNGVPINV